jgi:hypothetical protein
LHRSYSSDPFIDDLTDKFNICYNKTNNLLKEALELKNKIVDIDEVVEELLTGGGGGV